MNIYKCAAVREEKKKLEKKKEGGKRTVVADGSGSVNPGRILGHIPQLLMSETHDQLQVATLIDQNMTRLLY